MKTYKEFIVEVRSITKFELDKLFQKTLLDIHNEKNEERIKKRMNSFAKEIEKNPMPLDSKKHLLNLIDFWVKYPSHRNEIIKKLKGEFSQPKRFISAGGLASEISQRLKIDFIPLSFKTLKWS